MSISLLFQDNEMKGEFALKIPPGTLAAKRDQLLDELLTEPIHDAAIAQKLVIAADPHDFARPLDGLDESGATRFVIHGRVEAGCLLPVRRTTPRKRR